MTTEDFAQGIVFGAFMQEVRAFIGSVDGRLARIEAQGGLVMDEIVDLQAKVESQTAEISQLGTDFTELTGRVDTLLASVSAQVEVLTAQNVELTTQRDALETELGADHAAVTAVSAVIEANSTMIADLSGAADAFHAEPAPEPPVEG